MTHVREAIRRAAWRLWIVDFLRILAVVLTGGVGLVLLTRLVERIFGLTSTFEPLWGRIAIGVAIAVVVVTVVWTHVARKRALAVATELDERAGLKDALSTALCVGKAEDPWSRAVVETAEEKAGRVDVKGAIPISLPRLWPMPLATLLALLIAWMAVPRMDILGLFAKEEEVAARKREVKQVKEERAADQKKLEELLKRANVDFKDEPNKEGQDGEPAKELDPEAIRRAAVRDLTNKAETLQQKEAEKAAQMEAMKQAMEQLKTPGDGPLNEFSRSLARGDFNKAQEALEQISKQLTDSSMTPEQKEQLKKQMENLAEQLKKVGDQQEQLTKKLQDQGLDKKTAEALAKKAADPEALKQAMEQMKNLSPEQVEQLMKMAKSACQACDKAGEMGESMSKMAQGMSQEGMQQEGMEGMEGMQAQLSEMEMMASDMENLDAALSECQGQLAKLGGQCEGGGDGENESDQYSQGLGKWREGNSNRMGGGSGGPGRSQGGTGPEEAPADYTQEKKKAPTQDRGGATIGSRLVFGEQVKGESRAEFTDVVTAAAATAAESIDSGQVAREYHGPVKHYFGTMRKKGGGDAAKPAAPSGPVENAKDAEAKK